MAALKLHRFRYTYEADNFLRGGIRLPLAYKGNEKIYGLHGLTLIFTAPSGTVTFADASGQGLWLSEVIAQIKAAISTLVCQVRDGALYIEKATPAAVILAATGTASALFGITATITGVLYSPYDGSAPRMLHVVPTIHDDGVLICTEE